MHNFICYFLGRKDKSSFHTSEKQRALNWYEDEIQNTESLLSRLKEDKKIIESIKPQ